MSDETVVVVSGESSEDTSSEVVPTLPETNKNDVAIAEAQAAASVAIAEVYADSSAAETVAEVVEQHAQADEEFSRGILERLDRIEVAVTETNSLLAAIATTPTPTETPPAIEEETAPVVENDTPPAPSHGWFRERGRH